MRTSAKNDTEFPLPGFKDQMLRVMLSVRAWLAVSSISSTRSQNLHWNKTLEFQRQFVVAVAKSRLWFHWRNSESMKLWVRACVIWRWDGLIYFDATRSWFCQIHVKGLYCCFLAFHVHHHDVGFSFSLLSMRFSTIKASGLIRWCGNDVLESRLGERSSFWDQQDHLYLCLHFLATMAWMDLFMGQLSYFYCSDMPFLSFICRHRKRCVPPGIDSLMINALLYNGPSLSTSLS